MSAPDGVSRFVCAALLVLTASVAVRAQGSRRRVAAKPASVDETVAKQMDAMVKQALAGRLDPQVVLDLSKKMETLPPDSVDRLFAQTIKKNPDYVRELDVAWAWQLAVRDRCDRARDKLKGVQVDEPFWQSSLANVKEKCHL